MPRKNSTHADTLASLVATLALPPKVGQKVFVAIWSLYHPKQTLEINMVAKKTKSIRLFAKFQLAWNLGIGGFRL